MSLLAEFLRSTCGGFVVDFPFLVGCGGPWLCVTRVAGVVIYFAPFSVFALPVLGRMQCFFWTRIGGGGVGASEDVDNLGFFCARHLTAVGPT